MKKVFKVTSILLALIAITAASACTPPPETPIYNENVTISSNDFNGKTFPFLYIDCSSSITKEAYSECKITVNNTDEEYILDEASARIKGRGNSTWGMPKKPYKIKFDSKVDLFGNGAAKEWVLLANYCDKSLSRFIMASEIGLALGLTETSGTQPVNVMLNGTYQGVYLVCEQVEIGKNRVNIKSDLTDIDTGYLIEMDARAADEGTEGVDYFTMGGYMFALKDPDREDKDFKDENFEFIVNYFDQCYEAITGNEYEKVKAHIDVTSFAKCYIVHEMLGCTDVSYSSFFLYKKAGDKLYAGPVWDFDISCGNCDYQDTSTETDELYARDENLFYKNLMRFPEFKAKVADILNTNKDLLKAKIDEVYEYQMEYKENNEKNFEVWSILDKYVWPNPKKIVKLKTFEKQLSFVKDWITDKLDFMLTQYKKVG